MKGISKGIRVKYTGTTWADLVGKEGVTIDESYQNGSDTLISVLFVGHVLPIACYTSSLESLEKTWTREDEAKFDVELKRRKLHEKEVMRLKTIESLQKLIEDLESGKRKVTELTVDYVRHDVIGYPMVDCPPYAMDITFRISL